MAALSESFQADRRSAKTEDEMNSLRDKLRANQTTLGMWVTLEAARTVAEVASALALDWAVIEMEHGQLTWSDVANHVRVLIANDYRGAGSSSGGST